MTLRSLTSFTLQPEHLQELQESILLDQGALQDVRSAIVELSARIQHRTSVLGSMIQGGNAEEVTRAVQHLAGKFDSELEVLRSEAAKASDTNQETRARLMSLDNAMSMVSERLATVEKQAESRESAGREATSSGPQLFAMTPGKSPSFGGGSPSTAWWHEGENDAEDHWSEWGPKGIGDNHPWGLSTPPPGLPSEFTNGGAQADTTAASLGGESPQTAKGKFAVPNAKWKTLQDIPSFNPKDGAGSPWELALRLDVWKRQVLTLAATVQPLFADYVAECFKQAQERHDRRAAGESLTPLIPVTGFPAEYEARLVMILLRVLPDSVKTPALEADEGHRDIASLRLLEELYLCVRPGGLEEQQTLVKFLRNVSPAATARDAIDMLRRWRLAKSRVASLSLPEIPAYEQIKGIQAMIKTLEKKYDSLRTRMSLVRILPDVQLGRPQGVVTLLDTVETELRQLAADEMSRDLAKDDDSSIAAKGKGKDKGGKGKDKGSKGKGKEKEGKSSAKQGKGDSSSQNDSATDQRKNKACMWFWTENGCYRKNCPYSHDEKHKPKPKAAVAPNAAALVGADGDEGPKGKAKAKPKAKAKASAVTSTVMMARSNHADDFSFPSSDESGSDLEELSIAGTVDSADSTLSALSSERELVDELADAMQNARVHWEQHDQLWRLHLSPQEFHAWVQQQQHGEIITSARPFVQVTQGRDVAVGVAWTLERAGQPPIRDLPIGEAQRIAVAYDVMLMCDDDVARKGFVAWLLDEDDQNELFLAVIEAPQPPHVRFQAAGPSTASASNADIPQSRHAAQGHHDALVEAAAADISHALHMPLQQLLSIVDFPEGRTMFDTYGVEILHDLMYLHVQEFAAVPEPARRRLLRLRARIIDLEQGSRVQKVCAVGHLGDGSNVLLDTGANEVLRKAPKAPPRSMSLELLLADSQTIEASRTRDGEVVIPGTGPEVIAGVCRLTAVGCKFVWSDEGAWLQLPKDPTFKSEWIRLEVHGGLPYLDRGTFIRLRPLLSKWWKRHRLPYDATVSAAEAAPCEKFEDETPEELMTTTAAAVHADTAQEELQISPCEALILDEEAAGALLQKGPKAWTHAAIMKILRSSSLKPVVRYRGCVQDKPRQVKSWLFGAWTHGGCQGLSKQCKARPQLTRLINAFLRKLFPTGTWTSIIINDNITFVPHRDSYNMPDSDNFLVCVSSKEEMPSGGRLWIEDSQGQELRQVRPNHELLGKLVEIRGKGFRFSPRCWHGTEAWEGRRVVLNGHSTAGARKLSQSELSQLVDMGFPLPLELSWHANFQPIVENVATSEESGSPNGTAENITTTTQNQQHTPQNPVSNSLPLSQTSGHCEFWKDVCEAQAGSNVVQDCQLGEFRDGLGSSSIPDGSAGCVVHSSYQKDCLQCQGSRGHRKAHYKLSAAQVSSAVLSFDLSGPHVRGKDASLYFLVGAYVTDDKKTLPYVRTQESKKAEETLRNMKSIILQVRAEFEDPTAVVRVHSDGGKEFVASQVVEQLFRDAVWKTCSSAYDPQANGRAERQVQAIKERATSLLLHADMPRSFWPYAVKQATHELRLSTIVKDPPLGMPTFGDPVGVRIQGAEPFAPRVREGIFLCVEETMQDGSQVIVDTETGTKIMTTRLPEPLDAAPKHWRKVLSPEEDVAVWVARDGSVRWTEPNPDEIVTLEERLDGPEAADHEAGVATIIRKRIQDDDHDHASPFLGMGHSTAVSCQAQSKQSASTSTSQSLMQSAWLQGKSCTVCGLSSAECLAKRLKHEDVEPRGYQIDTADQEAQADEQARLITELATMKASAEPTDGRVFFEGSQKDREKWHAGALAEMTGMHNMGVLEEISRDSLHKDLGLAPGAKVPRPLPTKLVTSRKPEEETGGESKVQGEPPWKAKVRLCACGNFEAYDGAEVTTQNVSPTALRIMGHELSAHSEWVAASGDVSLAFLNSKLDDDDIVLLEPPSALRRLGLVKPKVLWRARKHIYGLRRSPRAWSQLRDDTIDGKEIACDEGSFVAELVSDEEGLFVLRDCRSQEVVGIAAVYVDDVLVVGQASSVTAFMEFVGATWNTKFSGFISRAGPEELRKGDFSLKRVQELTFIGLQIQFGADGEVKFHQKRWILNELHQRNWVHLRGSQSLPQVEFVGAEDPEDPGYAAALKKAQTELGCLLWVATKSRGDLLSAVSIAASHLHKCPAQVLKIAHGCWRYLRGTLDIGVCFAGSTATASLEVWSDASFAPEGSRSRSGGVITLSGSPLTWWSTKQSVTAWSVCEAETDGLATAMSEASKVLPLLEALTGRSFDSHVKMFGDNSASITVANRETFFVKTWRTRAFALRASWLRDQIRNQNVLLQHHPGATLVADMLTKVLSKTKLAELRSSAGFK
ncbi:Copia protein [Symbiodinium microadriaticum]|uniref:Copia protein n=1 Tax=Symbiodinium microadriaticum TaxID=2951 RepID=A0A1Q9E9K3_SYMMI|nr:Copia protein [Symbiodinium microadriaticum]OLQ04088.1 Copia protein [Symbiodinium microadriaticum]